MILSVPSGVVDVGYYRSLISSQEDGDPIFGEFLVWIDRANHEIKLSQLAEKIITTSLVKGNFEVL